MKKLFAVLLLAVSCVSSWAVDLPVPEELVGAQTIGILHVHLKALKPNQTIATITEKLGAPPDPEITGKIKTFVENFKEAGGQGVSIIMNSSKDVDPAKSADSMVFVITKGENADSAKLTELFAGPMAGIKDKLAPGCPKEIGDTLVYYTAGYKMPKANEDRATAFSEAYSHLAKDSSVSIVIVPDEEAVAAAEEKLKDAKPNEARMMKALLSATGICVFTDFGVATDPALKVMVLAADADGAVTLDKAAKGLIAELNKDMPPPVQAVLTSLTTAQIGANVQMSVNIGDLVKAAKAMAETTAAEAPAAK